MKCEKKKKVVKYIYVYYKCMYIWIKIMTTEKIYADDEIKFDSPGYLMSNFEIYKVYINLLYMFIKTYIKYIYTHTRKESTLIKYKYIMTLSALS